ncbi:hypothetical protein [Kumtagia ephedrae]|jgi:hypothetical protein|uniref:hypothetical protein n=1 Tax=Kumtagia ephedrae TaxID=2116701 RepID=UPI0014037117|nr:hypothetical protein [Mesorhizobium ephedrae]
MRVIWNLNSCGRMARLSMKRGLAQCRCFDNLAADIGSAGKADGAPVIKSIGSGGRAR